MSRIRRTKSEIEAGLSVADKKAGTDLNAFLLKKNMNTFSEKKKVDKQVTKTTSRARRTKEEIVAGLTLEEKQRKVTLNEYNFEQEKLKRAQSTVRVKAPKETKEERHTALIKWLQEPLKQSTKKVQDETKIVTPYKLDKTIKSEDSTIVTHYKSREVVITKHIDVPVIREVRVLFGDDGTPKTVNEIIRDELDHVTYEWKRIPMDKTFNSKTVDKLGEQGWRFTHIWSPRHAKESWKTKPDEMFFTRPKPREDGKSKRTRTTKERISNSPKNAE